MANAANSLLGVGFTPEEARVYEAALMLGRASVTEIARKSGLKRTSVYHYMETLLRHNLLSKEVSGKRIVYTPQNPEKILKMLEKQRSELESALPDLITLYTTARKKPKVEFLENKAEIRNAYLEISEQFSPVYTIFSVRDFSSTFSPKELSTLNANLEKNETPVYELIEDNAAGKSYMKSYKRAGHQIRMMPKKFTFKTDTLVANNVILLVSFKNMFGIKIENDDISEFFKSMFMLIWENTRRK